MSKWVHLFHEIEKADRMVYGGKGAGLADMTRAGLPVPPGFVVTTKACHAFNENGQQLHQEMLADILSGITALSVRQQKGFGDPKRPLLVSVRSGAPVSMPGMMDTILNLGLNDDTVVGLATLSGDPIFAYACYHRFIQMYAEIVLGVPRYHFEKLITTYKQAESVTEDHDLSLASYQLLIHDDLELVFSQTGKEFPQDVYEQLFGAIAAVFLSWNNDRAKVYRRIHHIAEELGTAVNVQCMVFGNLGEFSGTGVVFTRNPSTGERKLFGEYLMHAQGEDIVAGIRTPNLIDQLSIELPEVYHQLHAVCQQLETYYRDVQDIEFTFENGTLYLLQTRSAKRSATAAVQIATDLVHEGLIAKQEALQRIAPEVLDQLLHPSLDESAAITVLTRGLPASPGAVSGRIVFTADEAVESAAHGHTVLLVRHETSPEDIHGILAASGILTSRGGMTSHAAVVARGMGKPCVCGCDALHIDEQKHTLTLGERVLHGGDMLSIDGATGRVIEGIVPVKSPHLTESFRELMSYADEVRALGIRANADTPEDARLARRLGAEGIGLCRTEHMFMAEERIPLVQKMILAGSKVEREEALRDLLPLQEHDFYGILQAMDGLPVTIRLLDPPLHEFLPNREGLIAKLATLQTKRHYEPDNESIHHALSETETLLNKVQHLHEHNPMLGQRGCRLGFVFPEVYDMQVRAICRAAFRLIEQGATPMPEIMIPLVGHAEEFRRMRTMVEKIIEEESRTANQRLSYLVGTMIEIPRAALTSDQIAREADFFSFGTNDLTQTTLGYSRDDAEGKFLQVYLDEKILAKNPFTEIDRDGVGQLITIAKNKGRYVKPSLKLGICGEHGGEKNSIAFCHQEGLNYVSCSPYRVPIARLAAAHAALS